MKVEGFPSSGSSTIDVAFSNKMATIDITI